MLESVQSTTHDEDAPRVLIITSSGGSGHLMAALSKRYQIHQKANDKVDDLLLLKAYFADLHSSMKSENTKQAKLISTTLENIIAQNDSKQELIIQSKDNIFQYDVMQNWAPLGQQAIKLNDSLARNGNVEAQQRLTKMQSLADTLYAPFIMYHLIRALIVTNATEVVDTQVVGTKAIIRAVRFVNWFNRLKIEKQSRKPIHITKVFTDLPTSYAQHMYCGIKTLSSDDKKCLTIETLPPLFDIPPYLDKSRLNDKQIKHYRNLFWQKQLNGIDDLNICYTTPPIRTEFLDGLAKIQQSKKIYININNQEEEQCFTNSTWGGKDIFKSCVNEPVKTYCLKKHNQRICSIMLGSTGGVAIKEYIALIAAKAVSFADKNLSFYCFVFCGRHLEKEKDFYNDIINFIHELKTNKNVPNNFIFIPVGLQNGKATASILAHSDTIIIRPGGLLSMELLNLLKSKQQCFIHSSVYTNDDSDSKNNTLMNGLLDREKGNALYLLQNTNAEITTPQMLKHRVPNFLLSIQFAEQFAYVRNINAHLPKMAEPLLFDFKQSVPSDAKVIELDDVPSLQKDEIIPTIPEKAGI